MINYGDLTYDNFLEARTLAGMPIDSNTCTYEMWARQSFIHRRQIIESLLAKSSIAEHKFYLKARRAARRNLERDLSEEEWNHAPIEERVRVLRILEGSAQFHDAIELQTLNEEWGTW